MLLALLSSCASSKATPQMPGVTTIYLVRHAEKDTTPGLADPPLSGAGTQRALALSDTLKSFPIAAIFTTATTRTRSTVAPLAETLKLAPQEYDPRQSAALVQRIKEKYRGKVVVVVGHSNTLLPLIQALGATPPVREIAETDYSYLFEVDLPNGMAPIASVRRYEVRR